MATLSDSGQGYRAVYEKDKTREQRENALSDNYVRNVESHNKTKKPLHNGILAVWVLFFVLDV